MKFQIVLRVKLIVNFSIFNNAFVGIHPSSDKRAELSFSIIAVLKPVVKRELQQHSRLVRRRLWRCQILLEAF